MVLDIHRCTMVTRQMGSSASSPMHSCCTATDLQEVRSCFCLPVATICVCPHFVGPKAAEPMLYISVCIHLCYKSFSASWLQLPDDNCQPEMKALLRHILDLWYTDADDRIYIEHEYLYDADDIRQQRTGSCFLEQHPMADLELVHSSEVYHSVADVIDGVHPKSIISCCGVEC